VVSPARPSQTLAADSYGRSVRSGQRIPDERLEADPLAELTIEEAATAERDTVEEEATTRSGWCRPAIPSRCSPRPTSPEEEQAGEEDYDEPTVSRLINAASH
jgi:hypothetical protein